MTMQTLGVFETTIQKTHEWLSQILDDLGWNDQHRAYAVLRGTLHALRDRLTTEEAAQLSAQLPMLVRGLFFEGWKPSGKPQRIRHLDEFLDEVQRICRIDLGAEAEPAVRAVFRALADHVTAGEITDVIRLLPDELRTLWPNSAAR